MNELRSHDTSDRLKQPEKQKATGANKGLDKRAPLA
jgi:hypothetical protein